MTDTPNIDPAEATEAAWSAHYDHRARLTDALLAAIGPNAATNGIGGSALAAVIDIACTTVATNGDLCANLASTYVTATKAQADRDAPPEPQVVTDSVMDVSEPEITRDWLRTITAAELETELAGIADDEHRQAWAARLEEWARADGARADVLDVLVRYTYPSAAEPPPVDLGLAADAPPDDATPVDITTGAPAENPA